MGDRKTTGSSAIKPDRSYTVEEYKAWPDDTRWELIYGHAYAMSPAPRPPHQRIVLNVSAGLEQYLSGSPCEPFIAPVDVYLAEDTVVQPDVIVVCRPEAVTDEGIVGAPELVIEVLSDSTAYRDLNDKKALYETAGVSEYWIINPGIGSVMVWHREDAAFGPVREYRLGEAVRSSAVSGLEWRFPEALLDRG